jgi:hypothetical protein
LIVTKTVLHAQQQVSHPILAESSMAPSLRDYNHLKILLASHDVHFLLPTNNPRQTIHNAHATNNAIIPTMQSYQKYCQTNDFKLISSHQKKVSDLSWKTTASIDVLLFYHLMIPTEELICLSPLSLSQPTILTTIVSYQPRAERPPHKTDQYMSIHHLQATQPLTTTSSWSYYRSPLIIETTHTDET